MEDDDHDDDDDDEDNDDADDDCDDIEMRVISVMLQKLNKNVNINDTLYILLP